MDALLTHAHAVTALSQQLRSFPAEQLSLANHPHPSNLTRSSAYKAASLQLDTNHLNQILAIDLEKMTVWVEPRVTMEELARATLKMGVMVPVLPEFKGITVGGAIVGGGLESASHRHGLFSDQCVAYELLLSDGEVIWATAESHSDLFHAIPGSYGALALILSVKLCLTPAKPWVVLECKHFERIEEAADALSVEHSADFLEGLALSASDYVVIEGSLSETKQKGIKAISLRYPWSQWFYLQVKELKGTRFQMPLFDYLFRHDRGAFWIGAYGTHWTSIPRYFLESRWKIPALARFLPPFKPQTFQTVADPGFFYRLLLGWTMTSHRLYAWLHTHSEEWVARHFVIQDFCLPANQVAPFIRQLNETVRIFPLWLCPTPAASMAQPFAPHYHPHSHDPRIINVGVYGISPNPLPPSTLLHQLERWTEQAHGRKVFYTHSTYTPEQFWHIYPKEAYEFLRQKYHAEKWIDLDKKLLNV